MPLPGIYFIIVGVIMILGGVMGFVKARSRASLIAGSVSGGLLIVSGCLLSGHSEGGAILALVVCLALVGRFLPALLRGKRLPAAYVAPLTLIGAILAVWLLLHPTP